MPPDIHPARPVSQARTTEQCSQRSLGLRAHKFEMLKIKRRTDHDVMIGSPFYLVSNRFCWYSIECRGLHSTPGYCGGQQKEADGANNAQNQRKSEER